MNRQLSALAILVFVMALAMSACGQLTEDNGLLFRTADPRLNIGFRLLPPPPPLPTVTPSVAPTDTCNIKVNWNGKEWIYHMPGQVNYMQTIVEESKGEFFACNEQEAIDAGARKALR